MESRIQQELVIGYSFDTLMYDNIIGQVSRILYYNSGLSFIPSLLYARIWLCFPFLGLILHTAISTKSACKCQLLKDALNQFRGYIIIINASQLGFIYVSHFLHIVRIDFIHSNIKSASVCLILK